MALGALLLPQVRCVVAAGEYSGRRRGDGHERQCHLGGLARNDQHLEWMPSVAMIQQLTSSQWYFNPAAH